MAHNDFQRYVWLINQLNISEAENGGMTFQEIDDAWRDAKDLNPEEKPLPRRTFHNHINAIREVFGLSIVWSQIEGKNEGKYKITVTDGQNAGQKEMMSKLSLNDLLDRHKSLKNRIIYEEQPFVYPHYLNRIVRAMKDGRMIELRYRKYGETNSSVRLVAPYCLKMYRRRWYLLAKEGPDLKTFALDLRTLGVQESGHSFKYPTKRSFDPEAYFADVFGIRKSPAGKVIVKTFGIESDYWRSAPLHHSQKEIATGQDYALFSLELGFDVWEFVQELLSRGSRIEVMEPLALRERIAGEVVAMNRRYADFRRNAADGSEKSADIAGRMRRENTYNSQWIPSWDVAAAAEKAAKGSLAGKAVRVDVFKNNNEIFAAGCRYRTDSRKIVHLPGADDPMLSGTKVYSERFVLGKSWPMAVAGTETSVVNDDAFCVARKKQLEGLNPAVLNLASAYRAGGGYDRGAAAQEENLCRVSTLSRSLYQYYDRETAEGCCVPFCRSVYPLDIRFGGIYSPGVTVFRDYNDSYRLLDEPWQVSVISVAALNFRETNRYANENLVYRSDDGGFTPEGLEIMQNKIRTIYRIAAVNGHDSLVLGAFGCGAFRLRPDLVARLFYDILEEDEFFGRFKDIRFAILECGEPEKIGINGKFAPFYKLFCPIS